MVTVALGQRSYDILLGHGLLEALPELLGQYLPAAHYAVITDSIVGPLYGKSLVAALGKEHPCSLITFPAGEWNKTRETWAMLTDQLIDAGLGRDGGIVALGGGVVGDLAGFVAATYLRGVPYVQVPTTLLAMVDSSVGGKTGVDTPRGKNLVGAFHQPRAVIADVRTLASLPEPQVMAGMAEAIKHGAIADRSYFEQIVDNCEAVRARDPGTLTEIVRRSVEIKSAVVTADELEASHRSILNFGHTVAHALETVLGYEILHGEAVALGMIVEAGLGERLGITCSGTRQELLAAVQRYRLPHTLPSGIDREQLLEVMTTDKKVRCKTVRFALLERIGVPARSPAGEWTIAADEALVRAELERVS